MLAEVERALNVSEPDDDGIPDAETTRPGRGVAHPNGGIPHAETTPPGGIGYLDTDQEPIRTSDRRPTDYDG